MNKILSFCILIILLSLTLATCSVTLGTLNINDDGAPKNSTDIVQEKPVTVKTDADVPVSAIP